MSRETLEDWVLGVRNEKKPYDLIKKFGVYNDLFFYFDLDICKASEFRKFLTDECDLEFGRKMTQLPDHYHTTFVDTYLYSSKVENERGDCNRYNLRFPNKGIIFSPNTLPCEDKEIGYKYSGLIQLGLFGSYTDAADKVVDMVEGFIIPQKVPIYVSTTNCENKKYQRFSAFIND